MKSDCMRLEDYTNLPNEDKLDSLYIINVDGSDYIFKSWREGLMQLRREFTTAMPFCNSFDEFVACFRIGFPSSVGYIIHIDNYDAYRYLDSVLWLYFRLSDGTASFIGPDDSSPHRIMIELKELLL